MKRPAPTRHKIEVKTPCPGCAFHGICLIEQQIEEDLVLTIEGAGRPVTLALSCSLFASESTAERPPLRIVPTVAPTYERVEKPKTLPAPAAKRTHNMSPEGRAAIAAARRRRAERERAEKAAKGEGAA